MKLFKPVLTFLLAGLLLITASTICLAAESWVTDAKTGIKIGWSSDVATLTAASWSGPAVEGKAEGKGVLAVTLRYNESKEQQGQGEVEMVAGLMDGKGVLKWTDGSSYDGYFKSGLKEGQGSFTWRNGTMFIGAFKNDTANGYGILKDSGGKVLYAGEWKDGKELAAPLKTDKILGIRWGASEDEAAYIMSERPKTRCQLFAKNGVGKWKGCYTTFNDENVFVELHFYQGKMYYVSVLSYVGEDQVMEKFNSIKQGVSVRYGAPSLEKGKYLDSNAWWDLNSGYWARLKISKNNNKPNPWPESQMFSHPFAIQLNYYHHETDIIVQKASGTTSGKDF